MNTNHLFVYGSLMLNIGSPMSVFLAEHAAFRGVGSVRGQLYDVGSYPGLIINLQSDREILGHIFELRNVEKVWQVLDEYEDYHPNNWAKSLYRRVAVEVKTTDGFLTCQTYIYNRSIANLARIESNNYADWWRKNEQHRLFIEQGGNAADYL